MWFAFFCDGDNNVCGCFGPPGCGVGLLVIDGDVEERARLAVPLLLRIPPADAGAVPEPGVDADASGCADADRAARRLLRVVEPDGGDILRGCGGMWTWCGWFWCCGACCCWKPPKGCACAGDVGDP